MTWKCMSFVQWMAREYPEREVLLSEDGDLVVDGDIEATKVFVCEYRDRALRDAQRWEWWTTGKHWLHT